jgi:branched-chain amino acid transport system permease protein
MTEFVQQVVDGAAQGSIYGAVALALVLIYRTTGIVNFAQGEMAMFSTFIAWALLQAGLPLGLAIALTLALSFVGGMAIERVVIRPVEGSDPLALVIVTLGLLILLNSGAGWIWGFNNRAFPSIFGDGTAEVAGVRVDVESLGIVAVMLVVVGLIFVLFQKTKLGLAMRAVAMNPESSRLAGIRVGRTLMIGWGLAALVGALAGALVAPRLFLDVNFMSAVLIYSFAAATLGGFDSPLGAIVGGWIIGISETLAGYYVDFIGADLKILVPLGIILVVLMIRPSGLFGSREVARV